MSRIVCLAILLLTALAAVADTPAAPPAEAAPAPATGSLWRPGTPSLFTDVRARKVGDLITVYVVQQSASSTTAKHATNKGVDVNAPVGTGWFSGFTGFGVKGSASSSGGGSNTASTTVTDRLTVSVAEILPNGNLKLTGERTIQLEKDTMQLKLTGIVRPEDISPDNTISSTLVAEQRIEMLGIGPIAQKAHPGLISRILSWIW
jgi:flagellar L-ring protein precursor FlgH